MIDSAKEMKDVWKYGIQDSIADFKANVDGLNGGMRGQRCHDVCTNYMPLRNR